MRIGTVVALTVAVAGCASSSGGTSSSEDALTSGLAEVATAGGAQKVDVTYTTTNTRFSVDAASNYATDVTIAVHGLTSNAVRAIVIDTCTQNLHERFDIVVQCDLATSSGDDGRHEPRPFRGRLGDANACRVVSQPPDVVSGAPDILLDRSTRYGDTITCSQEIAVVADGNWLTDPVSGSHNFKFQMSR